MQEFYVNNFRVDISRNQIVHEGEVIALEPKVLEVLQVLAKHPGQVVSHQTLLDAVWPNMVVAPNALQRCIGQLRKAFNDDGKTQAVIQTHPKRGYSLVAGVSIKTSVDDQNSFSPNIVKSDNSRRFLAVACILLVLVLLYSWIPTNPNASRLSQFNQLTPITATDTSEFYSMFSPDSRYVAFARRTKGWSGHFWLKDLVTNQEVRISKDAGPYGQPNWSEDGKRIAFTNLSGCRNRCNGRRCVNVEVLYVPLAISEPQPAKQVLHCLPMPHQGLQWLDSERLVYIENGETGSRIIAFNIENRSEEIIYEIDGKLPYSITYSFESHTLAVMQESPALQQELLLISPETKELEQSTFASPPQYGSWGRWYPTWDNKGENLLFSAGNRLYLADLDGNLSSHVIPTFQDISRPMFQPNGQSLAMTLGKVDRDLAELTLTKTSAASGHAYNERKLARSILREGDAQYQPNGDAIAFFSERSGSRQIWLQRGDQITQLSRQSPSKVLDYFVWSHDGKQLAAIAEKQLQLFDQQGNKQTINLDFRALRLYQWTAENQLLMNIADEQGVSLVLYDMASGKTIELYPGFVRWAQFYNDALLIADRQNKIRRVVANQLAPFTDLESVSTWSRFFVRNEKLYILSNDDHVWRYDFNSKTLTKLFHYPDTSIAMSDVSYGHDKILISKFVSAKKEIVLLKPIE